MKPLHKVVTASDVQSCLYYVHVNGINDERLRESLELEQNQKRGTSPTRAPSLPCENDDISLQPRLQNPSSVLNDQPEPPKPTNYIQPPSLHTNSDSSLRRKPVGNETRSNPKSINSSTRSSQPLLGPRSMHQRLHSVDSAGLEMNPERQNTSVRRWSEQPPMIQPHLTSRPAQIKKADAAFTNISKQQVENGEGGHSGSESTQSLISQGTIRNKNSTFERNISLTLIRRYGGMQWNVAEISTISSIPRPHNSPSIDYGRPVSPDHTEISIDILNPSYAKFSNPVSKDYARINMRHNELDREHSRSESTNCFNRRMRATSFGKGLESKAKSNSSGSSPKKKGCRDLFSAKKNEEQNMSKGDSETMLSDLSLSDRAASTGCTFLSPWGGVCGFYTGIAGRSLRCKHTVGPFSSSKSEHQSMSVSELRFNLPGSTSSGDSSRDTQSFTGPTASKSSPFLATEQPRQHSVNSTPKVSKRSSFLATEQPRQHSAISTLDEQKSEQNAFSDRLDLSLGQEQAGGGFGGKQAKLGKLIIEREGQKMLDLVVAANVSLWWRVYG